MKRTWRERLEDARVAKGIEVETLMKAAGLSSSYWTDIMHGRAATGIKPARPPSTPSIERLHSICRVLGKTLDQIYTGDDSEPLEITIIGVCAGEPEVWAPVDGKTVRSAPFRMLTDDYVAVSVEVDGLKPRYIRGDVVCGPKIEGKYLANLVGQDCIIETMDGGYYIKRLYPGSGRQFDLRSIDRGEDISGVYVKWAAPIQIILRGVEG